MTSDKQLTELFGGTRSVVKERYALLAPSGFANNSLPGWDNADCRVLISPALGARFSQFVVTLKKDGQGRGNTGKTEYFAYVLDGAASVTLDAHRHRLEPGDFVYIPPDKDIHFQGANSRLLIYQKRYQPLPDVPPPPAAIGHQREVKALPFLGNDGVRVQSLLPDAPAFDLAVHVFTYQPGAVLPFVQTPLAEHGILILHGQALCRLDADYHPVQAGDALWIAPYRPQWFLPMGKNPASYITYTSANRDPM